MTTTRYVYPVTDAAAIVKAFEERSAKMASAIEKRAASWRAGNIESGAIADANGRFHAPCNAFMFRGMEYQAGEYLPKLEACYEDSWFGSSDWSISFAEKGMDAITLCGTRAAIEAVKADCKAQANALPVAPGEYLGATGTKITVTCICTAIWTDLDGLYGPRHTMYFSDLAGNRVQYVRTGDCANIDVGTNVVLVGKIKSLYTTKKGEKVTRIERPKIKIIQ